MRDLSLGVPISLIAAQNREFVYFHCRICKRCVAKTPAELIDLAAPEVGIESFTERLKCTGCGQKAFFFRVGYPIYELKIAAEGKRREHST